MAATASASSAKVNESAKDAGRMAIKDDSGLADAGASSSNATPALEPAAAVIDVADAPDKAGDAAVAVGIADTTDSAGDEASRAPTTAQQLQPGMQGLAVGERLPLYCETMPTIKSYYRRVSRVAAYSSLFSVVLHFVLSAFLLWYAGQIPELCDRRFDDVFKMLGLWHAILGGICSVEVFIIRELMDAMCHGTLARKHEAEGRGDDFAEERASSQSEAKFAMRLAAMPTMLYALAQIALFMFSLWGLVVTFSSSYYCRHSKMILYLVFIFGILSFACSVYSGGSARFSYLKFVRT
eukprot:TRINITY_DN56576_c0_g1_i1.p1 TRINITY_DN56576_c0_g1~~TRINITY_DN56576_c0_g1_i1.p1  ORF type:complete len:296 (+),score=63.42 TRINITY_DN56576_c0_g1_i1:54-941(+)